MEQVFGPDGVLYGVSDDTLDILAISRYTGQGTKVASLDGPESVWGATFYSEARPEEDVVSYTVQLFGPASEEIWQVQDLWPFERYLPYDGPALEDETTYTWRVRGFDGDGDFVQTTETFVFVKATTLSDGYVSPPRGTPFTPFSFRVKYTDVENLPPEYGLVEVTIEYFGFRFLVGLAGLEKMDSTDTNYMDGAWFAGRVSGLDPYWSYGFAFWTLTDGFWRRWPEEEGTYASGPIVGAW